MKTYAFFIVCICTLLYSQKSSAQSVNPHLDGRWQLSITGGANFDLIGSDSKPESKLLGTRPPVAPMGAMRVNYLFSPQVGAYANLQVSLYQVKDTEYYETGALGAILEGLFTALFPVSKIKPAADLGVIYRIEGNQWSVYPTLGLGAMVHLPETNLEKKRKGENDESQTVNYTQTPSIFYVNAGVSVNYYITQNGFLTLNVNFQQPLQKTHAELITTVDSNEISRLSYETANAGRNLNIGIGYGVTF